MKSKIIVALLIMNMVISASAQNQNQYGLVYRDAVSENVVGKVIYILSRMRLEV